MAKHLNDWQSHREQISNLSALKYNYDATVYQASTEKMGWNIDQHRATLGVEPPGAPTPEGIFERAKVAIANYEFPDPKLISAIYDPSQELDGRNMLLRAQFAGMTFFFGVRVSRVIDEERKNEAGNDTKMWGYAYRTLQGHYEIGEITFVVKKDLVTGEVSFYIDAYSKPDKIPNLIHRLGFKLLGRPIQRYYARSSLDRMKEITRRGGREIAGVDRKRP